MPRYWHVEKVSAMLSLILLIVAGVFILAMIEAAKRTTAATEATALILLAAYLERARRHD
jgi:hypothetical protein